MLSYCYFSKKSTTTTSTNLTHNNNEWLKVNDEIKLEVDRLGVLSNRISLKK